MLYFPSQMETSCVINPNQSDTNCSLIHQIVLLPSCIGKQSQKSTSQINLVVIPGDQAESAFVRALQIVEIKFFILFILCNVFVINYKQEHRHANGVNSQRIHKHEPDYMFRRYSSILKVTSIQTYLLHAAQSFLRSYPVLS
jgi:hypothetical protein